MRIVAQIAAGMVDVRAIALAFSGLLRGYADRGFPRDWKYCGVSLEDAQRRANLEDVDELVRALDERSSMVRAVYLWDGSDDGCTARLYLTDRARWFSFEADGEWSALLSAQSAQLIELLLTHFHVDWASVVNKWTASICPVTPGPLVVGLLNVVNAGHLEPTHRFEAATILGRSALRLVGPQDAEAEVELRELCLKACGKTER